MVDVDGDKFFFDSELLLHIDQKNNEEAQEKLNSLKDSVNLVDGLGNTLLHYAAQYSNDEVVKYLIDLGAKIDAQNRDGKTPLLLAIESHDIYNWTNYNRKTIVNLLDAKADMHIRDSQGTSPLSDTLARRVSRLLVLLLKTLNDECSGDSERIAEKLMEANCSVYAALHLKNAEVTRLLLKSGCPLDPPYTFVYETVFLASIYMNHLENVRALLDHGADPNAEVPFQASPMMVYSRVEGRNTDPEILRLLLDRGANPTMILTGNHQERGKMQMYGVLSSCKSESVRVLLRSNVDLNARDNNGDTALHYVMLNNRITDFDAFEGKNFDANARNNQGLPPILSSPNVNLNALKLLISNGADPNAQCPKGFTLLMRMSGVSCLHKIALSTNGMDRDEQVVEYLLQHGADPQVVSRRGKTVFNNPRPFRRIYPVESVIAQLAMLEACGTPIDENIRDQIDGNYAYKNTFQTYRLLMKKMKRIKIWKSITAYKLLTVSDTKFRRYLRHYDFRLRLDRLSNRYTPMSYYCYAVREKISRILCSFKLKKKTIAAMSSITGIDFEGYLLVIDKIFSYLTEKDLQNFCLAVQ